MIEHLQGACGVFLVLVTAVGIDIVVSVLHECQALPPDFSSYSYQHSHRVPAGCCCGFLVTDVKPRCFG